MLGDKGAAYNVIQTSPSTKDDNDIANCKTFTTADMCYFFPSVVISSPPL